MQPDIADLFTSNIEALKPTGATGEHIGCCPLHDDKVPSLSANLDSGLWKCHAGCGGGDAADFAGLIGLDPAPYYRNGNRTHTAPPILQDTPLPDDLVKDGRGYYKYLRDNFDTVVKGRLPWTPEGIKKGVVGYDVDTMRFTSTQLSETGKPLNIKWGKGPGGQSPYNVEGHGRNRLYPLHLISDFTDDWIILAEGEKDTVTLLSHGYQAITGTAGAGSVPLDLSSLSKFKSVIIIYDADEAGSKGSVKMADAILQSCPRVEVLIASWPKGKPPGYDITDFFQKGKLSSEFDVLMLSDLTPYAPPENSNIAERATQFSLNSRQPILIRLSDVEPEDVRWLWNPYIPLGKLTSLEGDPAVGKTWLALQIAAIISNGHSFPSMDGVARDGRAPGRVIYMSAEDGLADTLRPRLDKVGADPSNIIALTGWREIDEIGDETIGMVSLGDIPVIEAALLEYQPSMLVVDPIQAYLGANIDMHRANEVRPVLARLSVLAERYNCAVLVVRHLNKSSQTRSIYRGLGSIDFAAAARSILLAGQDPENPQSRVIAHLKSSLAEAGPSMGYVLNDNGFMWTGISELTPEALLAPAKSKDGSAVAEAAEWLREVLRDEDIGQKELKKQAERCGISWATVRRAKEKIGARSTKSGFGKGANWVWTIDAQETP